MALLDLFRLVFRGAPGRLALVLGLTTGIAMVSASLAPTAAHADQITFGFTFGGDNSDEFEDGFFVPDDHGPIFRQERPRYLYPSRHAPRVDVIGEDDTDTCAMLCVCAHGIMAGACTGMWSAAVRFRAGEQAWMTTQGFRPTQQPCGVIKRAARPPVHPGWAAVPL